MFRRLFLAALLSGLTAFSGPALTTIQDVLYKADGTRFNGTLTITWNSFQAVDNSNIVTQSTTVKVIDGSLRIQLAPTTTSTPPANYRVTYNSDGRIQSHEVWSVPSSPLPLRVRDVRTSVDAGAADTSSTGSSGAVAESDVVGLIADLGARPLKGPAFAAGRVAVVDPTGMLGAVTGDASDCVHVDGSTGPCGNSSIGFVDSQSLTGIVDGSNTSFGLSAAPDPVGSLAVYRNGMLQKTGLDYNLTGNTVQFVLAATPQPGDTLLASFRTSGEGGSAEIYSSPQVLCSGAGGSTSSTTLADIGNCQIPAGVLQPGDRVEVRFDVAHQGVAGGFSVQVNWGGTTMVHRDAAAGDVLVAGRADSAILASGAQLSSQSFGTLLAFAAGVAGASDSLSSGLTVSFLGAVAQSSDSAVLANFTVIRIP
jgi:hypothetical protein